MSDLQGYPEKLCLIENEIDIHTDLKTDIFNCDFTTKRNFHFSYAKKNKNFQNYKQ
jgi:hypothetical protein